MKNFGMELLLIAMIGFSVQPGAAAKKRLFRHPYPSAGFWVTENSPGRNVTIVRYYATSIDLISEQEEEGILDIKKRSTKKYLNSKLSAILSKDSLSFSIPKLYEIN